MRPPLVTHYEYRDSTGNIKSHLTTPSILAEESTRRPVDNVQVRGTSAWGLSAPRNVETRCGAALAAIGTISLLVACRHAPVSDHGFERTDSAGIAITQSFRPSWADRCAWTVAPTPSLTIGAMHGPTPYSFDRIMSVRRLRDGGWVVGNMGDNTLRFYDEFGNVRPQAGGSGGGPSEFQQILGIEPYGQHLLVRQFGFNPNKVFAEDGSFIESLPVPHVSSVPPSTIGVFADRSLMLVAWPDAFPRTPGIAVKDATFFRVTADQTDRLLSLPAIRFVDVDPYPVPQEFGPRPAWVVADSLFYYGWTETFDIAAYDKNGALRQRIRRPSSPTPVTSEHKARYRNYMLRGSPGGSVPSRVMEQRRAIVDAMVFPPFHPVHGSMLVDGQGNLWVERSDSADYRHYQRSYNPVTSSPTSWDVFDPTGVWYGTVILPARFLLMQIGDDQIAGIWKNASDVEFVHVYGLRKPCTRHALLY